MRGVPSVEALSGAVGVGVPVGVVLVDASRGFLVASRVRTRLDAGLEVEVHLVLGGCVIADQAVGGVLLSQELERYFGRVLLVWKCYSG